MKDEDSFASHEPSPTTSDPERGDDSDGHPLLASSAMPQDVPSPTHPPHMERQLTLHHYGRLFLVVMVVLVVLAGGYGVFRAVSPPPRQALSTFQQTHCPFPLGKGLSEGKNVRCGFLVVPEDRSHVPGPTIRDSWYVGFLLRSKNATRGTKSEREEASIEQTRRRLINLFTQDDQISIFLCI